MHFNRGSHRSTLSLWISICCASLPLAGGALVQPQLSNATGTDTQSDRRKGVQLGQQTDLLRQLNASLQALVAKVSPAVVEVLVTGFGPVEETGEGKTAFVGRQSTLGSGVIVDPDGYVITNAHVVAGARSIEVIVTSRSQGGEDRGKTSYTAHLVGVHRDTDLALLKIDATALPYLPLDPKRPITQGQLVFALGNAEGLGNSVTMGVVSAVDRQPDPRLPMALA
jgi:serine protease Do